MSNKTNPHIRSARSAVSALLCASLMGGMALASFIFICGMKYMDGPQGARNEGPLIILLPMMALYFPVSLWFSLRKDGYDFFPGLTYSVSAGMVVYTMAAAVAGWSMQVVAWGTSHIQLFEISDLAAAAATLASVLLIAHYVLQRRLLKAS